jgi:hypothetical protein
VQVLWARLTFSNVNPEGQHFGVACAFKLVATRSHASVCCWNKGGDLVHGEHDARSRPVWLNQ